MNPEFYEDEVIEGFYVPSMLKKAWGVQLDVLNETDAICRRHNIPYFADWGTLLASIRHNGFIPWDDDLDISMRRADYEKFLKYAEEELPEGFKVMNYKNHPGHHFFVARIVGKPRICFEKEHLERFHGFPYIAGIDLFILDNVCSDRKKEKLKAVKAEYVITVADNIADGRTKGREAEEQLRQCEAYTGARIDRRLSGESLRVRMYELAEGIFASVPDEESDALVQMMPFGMYGNDLYVPKEFYRNTVRLPYMDRTMQVPLCYDAVMRRKFGFYMRIVKKWSGHDYPFFYGQHKDLLKALDFEYPAYKARKEDITENRFRKSGIKQAVKDYVQKFRQHAAQMKSNDAGTAANLQNDAVSLGTAIESVYGEGHECVLHLEKLCELFYRAYEGEDNGQEIKECISDFEKSAEERIMPGRNIVFMPFAPKHWKYMEGLYRQYAPDDEWSVHVVPIPYYYKAYDGSLSEEVFDPGAYPQDIPVRDYRTFDLECMHPEKLVIQNPFDEWNTVMSVPSELYSGKIREHTDELIYIPFFLTDDFTPASEREYTNMDSYVCMPGVLNADRVILPSETLVQTYIAKITEFTGTAEDEEVERLLRSRIEARPDLMPQSDEKEVSAGSDKKTVVFVSTISSLAENGPRAIKKINDAFTVFEKNSEKVKVIWVSFGIKEYDEMIGKDTVDGFQKARERFEALQLGEYIEDPGKAEQEELAGKCSAYYGEPSALALRFSYRGRPVMILNPETC